MSHLRKPRIAVTVGDPAGVGPEIVLKALADDGVVALAEWIVIGDAAAFASVDSNWNEFLRSRARFR